MLIIQNGYNCDYEMKLFYGLFFDKDEDVSVYSNFEYKNKEINVYTEIICNGTAYFEDYYFDNLSLSEIADNAKISRNAVHKHIKSTENKLLFFEDKLKLCQKEKEINNILESIEDENLKNKIKKIFN